MKTTTDDTIRAAIRRRLDDGESIASIAKQAGYCDHSQLARFLRGERGLATGAKFDGLLKVLGLKIQKKGVRDG
jgi:hypothetical protein